MRLQGEVHNPVIKWAVAALLSFCSICLTCQAQTDTSSPPSDPGGRSTTEPQQAQHPPSSGTLTPEQRQQLHTQAIAAFDAKDYHEALRILGQLIQDDPSDTAAVYNAACVQTALGHKEQAVGLLAVAIQHGFVNFAQMKNDPDLAALHDLDTYKALMQGIDKAYAQAADFMEQWSRQVLGSDAIIERNPDLHLIYATNLDRETFDRMKQTVEAQVKLQIRDFFGGPPDSYVLILVPTPEIADSIIRSVRVGGFYDHQTRRLVTRDIGPSLTHEITHALHHAQMDRLGQDHPIWIQEGLASLFELYDIDPVTGHYKVLDNSRINVAINLVHAAGLIPWNEMFHESQERFNSNRVRAQYAEARAIFQYLAEKGKLETWYKTYIDSYHEDSSGRKAFEIVFDRPMSETERDFRIWLLGKHKVQERVENSQPSIGVSVTDLAANDGAQITGISPGGAAAEDTDIRPGEVITAIDGKPMYVVEQIVYEVLKHQDGDTITVRLRKGKNYRDVRVRLRPLHKPERLIDQLAGEPDGTPV